MRWSSFTRTSSSVRAASMHEASRSALRTGVTPGSASDGHTGKAAVASLVGAAKSAPLLLDRERRRDNSVYVLFAARCVVDAVVADLGGIAWGDRADAELRL